MSVHKKGYANVEKQKNISINLFGYDGDTPCHIYTFVTNF